MCIGGATVDRSYRLAAPLTAATSNPAAVSAGFGGVARNVAENLARAGAMVDLVSRVGGDEAGRALLADLDAAGIGRRGVAVAPGEGTAEYVAVLTPGGELALGLAAMAVLDGLTPDALAAQAGLLATADWVFADCNLPAASLEALAARAFGGAGYRLAVDAVSVAKSARLPVGLGGVDLLFANRDEAAALATRRGSSPPADHAAALLRAGAAAVVVTLGAHGAIAASAEGSVPVPAVPARVVDVTGAGDALVAATIRALGRMERDPAGSPSPPRPARGASLAEAVAEGCRAAAAAVGCGSAVAGRA